MRWASVARAIYWIFIIGSVVGAYYLIQPYIDQIASVYSGAKSNLDSFNTMLQNFKK